MTAFAILLGIASTVAAYYVGREHGTRRGLSITMTPDTFEFETVTDPVTHERKITMRCERRIGPMFPDFLRVDMPSDPKGEAAAIGEGAGEMFGKGEK